MSKMTKEINHAEACKKAMTIVVGESGEKILKRRFDDGCSRAILNADDGRAAPSTQCKFKHAGDQFVLDKKQNRIVETEETAVILCFVKLAMIEKWLEKDDPVNKLPAAATPVQADPPKDPTPVMAVDAPKDVSPVADPTPAAVALPVDATATVTLASDIAWFTRVFVEIGVRSFAQLTGLSVNGADPVEQFNSAGYPLKLGALLTHITLPGNWVYDTAVFANLAMNRFDSEPSGYAFNIYDFGGGVSPQFSYPLQGKYKLIVAPDVAVMAGIMWSNKMVDVGIPGRAYWDSKADPFLQATAGVGVYFEGALDAKGMSFIAGLHSGGRWLWHQNRLGNLPVGIPGKTEVSLQSPRWDGLLFSLGVRK